VLLGVTGAVEERLSKAKQLNYNYFKALLRFRIDVALCLNKHSAYHGIYIHVKNEINSCDLSTRTSFVVLT
jgi:hypothetical protein